jgi:hypothetical protein
MVKLTSNQEEGNEHLVNPQALDKHSLQVMAKKSLAVISHNDEDKLELDAGWTFEQVEEFLRQRFPSLFVYLDTLSLASSESQGHEDEKPRPQWIVCCKVRKSLKPVPETFPTGKTLKFNKGTGRAGVQDSYVYIGMHCIVSGDYILLTCVFQQRLVSLCQRRL